MASIIDRRASARWASVTNNFVAQFSAARCRKTEKGRHLSAIFLGPASILTDAMNWEKGRHLSAISLGPASLLTDAMNWEKGRHLAAISLGPASLLTDAMN